LVAIEVRGKHPFVIATSARRLTARGRFASRSNADSTHRTGSDAARSLFFSHGKPSNDEAGTHETAPT